MNEDEILKKVFISIVILIALLGSGAAIIYKISKGNSEIRYSWRYKMTVEIETPEGLKSGSAVREVTILFTPNSSAQSGYDDDITMNGEAVVVDLGERGKIFAVQRYEDFTLPFKVFSGPPGRTVEGAKFYSTLKAQDELDREHYPMFITFNNINDPLSVQLVYGDKTNQDNQESPYLFEDSFKSLYGADFRIKRIMIEMTDENVVYKIQESLPWLKDIKAKRLDGNRFGTIDAQNRLANRLSHGSFTTKRKQ